MERKSGNRQYPVELPNDVDVQINILENGLSIRYPLHFPHIGYQSRDPEKPQLFLAKCSRSILRLSYGLATTAGDVENLV